MDDIKLATLEQIERIAAFSDINSDTAVFAMGDDLAVIRNAKEIDPVVFSEESTNARKLLFIWGIENCLRSAGFPSYYFNVAVDNEEWIKAVETHGAIRLSSQPEYRYKKVLIK